MAKVKTPKSLEDLGVDIYTHAGTPEFFTSGSTLLDLSLGGGWSENRIINIVGDSATAKSFLAILASHFYSQKYPDRDIIYVETEAAFDPFFAESIGLPLDKVLFPKDIYTVEQLFKVLKTLLDRDLPCLVIVDSLDALSTDEEAQDEFSAGYHGARKAERMSSLFRQMNSKLSKSNITVIIVSQTRDNVGVLWGRKWRRAGGKSLDFYSSQIVVLSLIKKYVKVIQKEKAVIGIEIKAVPDKNRFAPPFRPVSISILFRKGIQDNFSCSNWLKSISSKETGLTPQEAVKIEWKRLNEALSEASLSKEDTEE